MIGMIWYGYDVNGDETLGVEVIGMKRYGWINNQPHNSSRGFFFAHVGWLLVRKHPEVKRKGATIDLEDLKADPVVRFQRKYYIPLVLLIWGVMPTVVPVYYWNEVKNISQFITNSNYNLFSKMYFRNSTSRSFAVSSPAMWYL